MLYFRKSSRLLPPSMETSIRLNKDANTDLMPIAAACRESPSLIPSNRLGLAPHARRAAFLAETFRTCCQALGR